MVQEWQGLFLTGPADRVSVPQKGQAGTERNKRAMELKITCIPGDGIGPEIVAEARKVLDTVAKKYGHDTLYRYSDGRCVHRRLQGALDGRSSGDGKKRGCGTDGFYRWQYRHLTLV